MDCCIFRIARGSCARSGAAYAACATLRSGTAVSRQSRVLPPVVDPKVRRFVETHAAQFAPSVPEMRSQASPDFDRDILYSRHNTIERRHFVVQEPMVERGDHFALQ